MFNENTAIVLITVATMCVTLCASLVCHWVDWIAACLRRGAGRCGVCGYGLIGLPVPRCPECGQAFDTAVESKRFSDGQR